MAIALLPRIFLITVLSLLLVACGGGSSGGDGSQSETNVNPQGNDSEPTVQVSGYAIKGVITSGLISAQGIEPDGSLVALGQPVRTNEVGYYELDLPAGNRLIKLELTSDGDTRMRCDAVDGCQGYAGEQADFGEDFWPGPNLKLETIVAIEDNRFQSQGHLTPLTSLSTTLFEARGAASGSEGYHHAQADIEAWFGLQKGAVAATPLDITAHLPADLTVADLEAALVNSAFLALARDFPVEGVQGAINAYRERLLATGQINEASTGGELGSDRIREYASVHAYTLAEGGQHDRSETLLLAGDRLFDSKETELPVAEPEPNPVPDSDVEQPATQPVDDIADNNDPIPSPDPAPVIGSATLSWQAPLTRENGEALSMGEIDQYVVRYGISPDVEEMSNEVVVEDGQAMTYEISGLQEGTWYFAMRTVDQDGLESAWSQVASKTVRR